MLSLVVNTVIIAAVTLLVIGAIKPRLVKTLWSTLQAWLGQASRDIEAGNVGVLLSESIAKTKATLATALDGLHTLGGKKKEAEAARDKALRLVEDLKHKAKTLSDNGFANDSPELMAVATKFVKAEADAAEAALTVSKYVNLYTKLSDDVSKARAKIEADEAKAQSLSVQLDVASAAANLPALPEDTEVQTYMKQLEGQVHKLNARAEYDADPVEDVVTKLQTAQLAKGAISRMLGRVT